ncbi:MAG: ADP-heptose--LPS heptosyltransferase [Chloroflexi bacterium]|nr:ADP-heptose--LPS heptosyltransferase [Chloroflexota bacterium]
MSTWAAAMRRGDFRTAWQIGDGVLAARPADSSCEHLPRHEQWVWDGRPLAGQRVLVRCYHGLGDTLQFARFLPELAEISRELTVWIQPTLIPLLKRVSTPASMMLLPLHDGTPEVDYDVDIEIMELAHALRATTESLASRVPYFAVRAEPRRSVALSIGLVALAGDWDPRRCVPPQLMATLAELPATRTFSLQLGAPVPRTHDISTTDILTLAERIRGLDLIVTADTMVAHLAGALAAPTWTLLPAEADWRWMANRDDSPWYPTMRLFRQPSTDDWDSVLRRVRAALVARTL